MQIPYACDEYCRNVSDMLSLRIRLAYLNSQAALQAVPRVTGVTHSLTHSHTHLLTHSLTHIHSRTHPRTQMFMHILRLLLKYA